MCGVQKYVVLTDREEIRLQNHNGEHGSLRKTARLPFSTLIFKRAIWSWGTNSETWNKKKERTFRFILILFTLQRYHSERPT